MKNYSIIIGLCCLCSLIYILWQYKSYADNRLHVVFCDVGQGDAIVIKTPSGKILVFDGGPDDSIMRCLSRQLPFWQKTVNLMLMSHPHADHFVGFLSVLEKYHVIHFGTEKISNTTLTYKRLQTLLGERHVPKEDLYRNDAIDIGDGLRIRVLAPTKELLGRTSPDGSVGDTKEFASLMLLILYKDFSLLLTGDSQHAELVEATHDVHDLTVLQVSHHGSATGIDTSLAKALSPRIAVISVGSHNRYGFPTLVTLASLHEAQIPILRTDQHGDIEIKTDGKTWSVH